MSASNAEKACAESPEAALASLGLEKYPNCANGISDGHLGIGHHKSEGGWVIDADCKKVRRHGPDVPADALLPACSDGSGNGNGGGSGSNGGNGNGNGGDDGAAVKVKSISKKSNGESTAVKVGAAVIIAAVLGVAVLWAYKKK